MDLHLHTPASADWQEPGVTYLEWLQKAESKGLDIVAITDHNTVEGVARLRAEIERLTWLEANDRLRPQERRDLDEYRRIGDKILVLPGFEFTAMFGFHILGIFPPETSVRKLELLLLRLNVPDDRLSEGSTEVGASTDVLTAYRLIREAGGIVIAAHANSTHGVALQGLSFGGQTKIAFTQDPNLHALEVTDLESTSRRATARFFDGSKPEYPRRMHCIQGSDAHRLNRDPKDKNRLGIGERVTEILLPEVSFEALKAVFEGDDFTRTRPYRPPAEVPFDHVEAAREQGNTIVQAFHEGMSREGGRLHKVLCDVVAFANTAGGTVYIGVSATRKTPPKGVENPESAVALLRREIERNVTPPLDVRVDVIQSLGVPIVRAIVPNGPDKPYALSQTRIYVRQEGETNEAVRDELVQLVLSSHHALLPPATKEEPAALPALVPESAPVPAEAVRPEPPREVPPEVAPVSVPAPTPPSEGLPLPAIGVEIIGMEERKGGRYFTIRDLRNGNVVQNVTIHSARKLWSYAISQHLMNPVDPARVEWRGEFGLWQVARRAKKLRYDLALRQPDGTIRVFYGVTSDGMTGPWAQFLRAEDREGLLPAYEHEIGHAPELEAEWEAALQVGANEMVLAPEEPLVEGAKEGELPVSFAPKAPEVAVAPVPEAVAEAEPAPEAVAETAVAQEPLAQAPAARSGRRSRSSRKKKATESTPIEPAAEARPAPGATGDENERTPHPDAELPAPAVEPVAPGAAGDESERTPHLDAELQAPAVEPVPSPGGEPAPAPAKSKARSRRGRSKARAKSEAPATGETDDIS
ncbi:MAG: putative DNA binding domain-containing protein [Anaerolineae bacterium]|nr:putative DNA binding domain-containing protein [Anaerolineae bacterium]